MLYEIFASVPHLLRVDARSLINLRKWEFSVQNC